MIVSKKGLIIAAAIPIVIAMIIAIPKISPGSEQVAVSVATQLRIEFMKEDMKRVIFGVTETIGAQKSEKLIVNNNGDAIYNLSIEGEKGSQTRFKVSLLEVKRLRSLIVDTGFMQIPKSEFGVKDDATEFTRYTFTVSFDSNTKSIQWFNEEASKEFVPALLVMLADEMQKIIKAHE